MHLTIKASPEDFIVTEIAQLPLEQSGEFGVYLLTKEGWNTLDVLRDLSHRLRLPFARFAYGGRKDRHAQTTQYITIQSPQRFDLVCKGYSLRRVGFMSRPMGPDLIEGNSFLITVRKLSVDAMSRIQSGVSYVTAKGFLNYFDDQRFGSFDPVQGFFAEKLLKQQHNGALKVYLTGATPGEKPAAHTHKRMLFTHWKDWEYCLKQSKSAFEKKVFGHLQSHPKDFLETILMIPSYEIPGLVSAYQSYLWNQMLRSVVAKEAQMPFLSYPGVAGDYLFPSPNDERVCAYLEHLAIPLVGAKPSFADESIRKVYDMVLSEAGIEPKAFNKMKLRKAFFKSLNRSVVAKPHDLQTRTEDDDKNPGRQKLRLRFRLGRGSFATMVLKRIFAGTKGVAE